MFQFNFHFTNKLLFYSLTCYKDVDSLSYAKLREVCGKRGMCLDHDPKPVLVRLLCSELGISTSSDGTVDLVLGAASDSLTTEDIAKLGQLAPHQVRQLKEWSKDIRSEYKTKF